MKTIAIICIGDELLDGRVVDANARYLIEDSAKRALTVTEFRIVGDDKAHISSALEEVSGVDLVVVSGGLGPTSDDVTRESAADFSDSKLVEDQAILEQLRERFQERNHRFTDNNIRQCFFPDTATILPTEVGTAAGFQLCKETTNYYFFPGVPHEFRWFADRYIPAPEQGEKTRSRKKLVFFGLGESALESRIEEAAIKAEPMDVDLGFRAEFPLIEVMLKGPIEKCTEIRRLIMELIGAWSVAEDDETFSARVGRRLVDIDATVTVAESCTAGLLAATLTEVSGSSRYFQEGYLTYSNQAKQRLVSVDPAMLKARGAVSLEVVSQMAMGARHRSGADFALAISGIAGPTGGTTDKPVGTVDIALAAPEGVYYRRSLFPQRSRHQVRVLSVHVAMALLLWRLEDRLLDHTVDGPVSYEKIKEENR